MTAISRWVRALWTLLLACAFIAPAGPAQAQEAAVFSQAELDQMLAPVALYPDPLLSQILMAATYPLEVVEAQRWTLANPSLRGADALQAVESMGWDPSVKSLLVYPRILQTMSSQLQWTQRLGDAFLGQQAQVMDTVQALRKKAYAAGNLVSNAQDQVLLEGDAIRIVPADSQLAFVPYYDPGVVYGPWWWPDYPPVYWSPWPGYAYVPGFGQGFLWGAGLVVGADFLFGNFDWQHHHVNVDYARFHDRHFHPGAPDNSAWQHNPYHRHGLDYRQPDLQHRFPDAQAPERARRAFRGFPQPPLAVPGRTPAMPLPTPVPAPVPAPQVSPRPHALENIELGRGVRDFSARAQGSVPPLIQAPHSPCAVPGACAPHAPQVPRPPGGERGPQRH